MSSLKNKPEDKGSGTIALVPGTTGWAASAWGGLTELGWANNIFPQLAQNAASGRLSALHFGQIICIISTDIFLMVDYPRNYTNQSPGTLRPSDILPRSVVRFMCLFPCPSANIRQVGCSCILEITYLLLAVV
jgi:hypothetical protein